MKKLQESMKKSSIFNIFIFMLKIKDSLFVRIYERPGKRGKVIPKAEPEVGHHSVFVKREALILLSHRKLVHSLRDFS